MRLTTYTDYSLRLLMYLADRRGERATIQDVAAAFGISRNHLMKVAYELGQGGFVETTRGRSGGLRLARPARDIGLGDIVRRTEPDFNVVECFDAGRNTCAIVKPCRLKGILHRATKAWLAVLDEYSLDDLVKDNTGLARLLQAPTSREMRP